MMAQTTPCGVTGMEKAFFNSNDQEGADYGLTAGNDESMCHQLKKESALFWYTFLSREFVYQLP